MALPQMTEEQRKEALEKARIARAKRAELREKIAAGKVSIADVLSSDDPIAKKCKVRFVLSALPGFGKAKVARVMEEVGIQENRRVSGLGSKQREKLLEILG